MTDLFVRFHVTDNITKKPIEGVEVGDGLGPHVWTDAQGYTDYLDAEIVAWIAVSFSHPNYQPLNITIRGDVTGNYETMEIALVSLYPPSPVIAVAPIGVGLLLCLYGVFR